MDKIERYLVEFEQRYYEDKQAINEAFDELWGVFEETFDLLIKMNKESKAVDSYLLRELLKRTHDIPNFKKRMSNNQKYFQEHIIGLVKKPPEEFDYSE